MLEITIPAAEYYDESGDGGFVYTKECTLRLEHSLVSLSKWESKWHKPFLSKEPKTTEETLDYFRCMTITQNVDPLVYLSLKPEHHALITAYLDDKMTATTFSDKQNNKFSREIITAEIVYYWMVAQQIPFECEKWHLNRLLTLIQVCNIKNTPPKKMSKKDILTQNHALNNSRRQRLGTHG